MKTKIVVILLCLVSSISLLCGQLSALANTDDTGDFTALDAYAAELNQTLADNGTTAEEQLEKLNVDLSNQLGQPSDTHRSDNLMRMNRFTYELRACSITAYSALNAKLDGAFDAVLAGLNQVARASVLGFLTPAVAVLSLMGHDLTLELLINSIMNQEISEPYIPAYGYKVKQSALFKNIANNSKTSGGEEFPYAIRGIDGDMFLSIHGFRFSKPYAASKTVTITDTYDYNDNEEALKKFPWFFRPVIKGMCKLERAGLATYYELEITEALSESFNVNENYGYTEVRPYVCAKEIKDYELSFSSSGRRLIQTFGSSKTKLYVLNEDGETLAYASGNGFGANSLLSFNFSKNKKYILRVKHISESAAGDIKLSVISDTRDAKSYSDLSLPTLSAGNYTATATANNAYIAKISPTEKKRYKITFTSKTLYRAFFIQTDSIEVYYGAYYNVSSGTNGLGMGSWSGNMLAIKDPVRVEIGGGGGGDSNVIAQTLTAGKQYLLIVCGRPANTSNLNVTFKIEVS